MKLSIIHHNKNKLHGISHLFYNLFLAENHPSLPPLSRRSPIDDLRRRQSEVMFKFKFKFTTTIKKKIIIILRMKSARILFGIFTVFNVATSSSHNHLAIIHFHLGPWSCPLAAFSATLGSIPTASAARVIHLRRQTWKSVSSEQVSRPKYHRYPFFASASRRADASSSAKEMRLVGIPEGDVVVDVVVVVAVDVTSSDIVFPAVFIYNSASSLGVYAR